MLCPSDQYNRQPYNGTSASSLTGNTGDGWARGDYAANAAMGYMTYNTGWPVRAPGKAWGLKIGAIP